MSGAAPASGIDNSRSLGSFVGRVTACAVALGLNFSASGLTSAVPGIHCHSHFQHLCPIGLYILLALCQQEFLEENHRELLTDQRGAVSKPDPFPTLRSWGRTLAFCFFFFFSIRMPYPHPHPGSFQASLLYFSEEVHPVGCFKKALTIAPLRSLIRCPGPCGPPSRWILERTFHGVGSSTKRKTFHKPFNRLFCFGFVFFFKFLSLKTVPQ